MTTTEDIIKDMKLPALKNVLLNKLRLEEITLKQFMVECAFWAIKDGFDELRLKPYPTCPPRAQEIENMPIEQREKLDFAKLCSQFPQVKYYYEQKLIIANHNKGVLDWLRDIKFHIPTEDTLLQDKLDNRIAEFTLFEQEQNELVEQAKKIFETERY